MTESDSLLAPVPTHPAEWDEPELPDERDGKNWPPLLDDDTAIKLFRAIEDGGRQTQVPKTLGLTYRTVRRWINAFPLFAERYEEAMQIGYDVKVDEVDESGDYAIDRDTAAAANAKLQARKEYLRYMAPARGNPRLALGTGNEEVVGIVLVPYKPLPHQAEATPPTVPVLEGSSVRVPTKALPA